MKSFGNELQLSPMPLTAVQANTLLVILAWLHVCYVNVKECTNAHVGNLNVDCESTQTECARFMCAKKKKPYSI